jgi:hypothetical protein
MVFVCLKRRRDGGDAKLTRKLAVSRGINLRDYSLGEQPRCFSIRASAQIPPKDFWD